MANLKKLMIIPCKKAVFTVSETGYAFENKIWPLR